MSVATLLSELPPFAVAAKSKVCVCVVPSGDSCSIVFIFDELEVQTNKTSKK